MEGESVVAAQDEIESLPKENDVNGETEVQAMSKRQLKKMKKREEYLSKKPERRANERQKRKLKRLEKAANNEDLGPSKKKLKQNTMKDSSCKVRVVVDCSFDDLMAEKDIMKLSQQLQYCYARNRRATNPMQLYLTSLEKKTLSRLDQVGYYKSWDINIKDNSYLENFNKEEIVYLTSDSPNVLESLSPEKVYIIGGLVDHNHHKGLCFNLAQKNEIGHAQLPIGQFMKLSCRNVLAVNHVFEILLKFTETQNWKESFYSVIPKRKIMDDQKADSISNDEKELEEQAPPTNDNNETKVDSADQLSHCSDNGH